jgi:hypothetical protein
MTTQRRSTGNRLVGPTDRPAVKQYPTRQFPTQRKIQNLEDELNAFVAPLFYECLRTRPAVLVNLSGRALVR